MASYKYYSTNLYRYFNKEQNQTQMLFSRDMRPSMIPYMLIYLSQRT